MAQVKDQEVVSDKEIIDNSATESNLATTENYNEKAKEKVQLDIEDAPFLEEPEEEKPQEEEKEDTKEEQEEQKPKKSKKKLIFLAGGGAAIVSALVVVAYFLFSPNPEDALPTPEELEAQALAENTYIVVLGGEQPPPPPTTPSFNETLEPFWVQLTKPTGGTVFLVSTFTLMTELEALARELSSVLPQIRDSIYYYLRTKDYNFLTDFKNFPAIKKEMLDLVNRELSAGEYTEVLYDNYITK